MMKRFDFNWFFDHIVELIVLYFILRIFSISGAGILIPFFILCLIL